MLSTTNSCEAFNSKFYTLYSIQPISIFFNLLKPERIYNIIVTFKLKELVNDLGQHVNNCY